MYFKKNQQVNSIQISDAYLILVSGENIFEWRFDKISKKLAQATETERNNFQISPSGYGIHWPQIDEDLSLHGLLRIVA
jgi:hypothetical protein